MNISFFNLRFDRFSIIAKKSQSNQKQCSLCCSSLCFCVLLCTHHGPLQCFSTYFRKSKEIGVLRPIFPDYLFLVTMDKWSNNRGYSLHFLMGIFPKYLWLIPNTLKWQDCKIFTKLVPSQTSKDSQDLIITSSSDFRGDIVFCVIT